MSKAAEPTEPPEFKEFREALATAAITAVEKSLARPPLEIYITCLTLIFGIAVILGRNAGLSRSDFSELAAVMFDPSEAEATLP